MSDSEERLEIQQLVARFANSFDVKDWAALGACLADELHTDYSDLRRTPPETMSRDRFVELRRVALQALRTHHLAGNVEIGFRGPRAEARVSMAIHRRSEEGATLNTHCLYSLGLERAKSGWVIDSIVQKVLMSDGEAAVHRGILET